ncbi:hypothetical protein AC579_8222 [Pseudocercospora musae]|uniref:Major facilitator superfamily (MFS) profile domain-containing protein n=1 Tax=Pseudocercospora musae TaxID=113226 RepID=A0A139IVX5_9PEZI|nr:hypothetical protein AC579_8222 [Pseudocercospora musae]
MAESEETQFEPESPTHDAPKSPQQRRSLSHRILTSTGLHTILHAPLDIKLILLQRFIRIFAFGLVSLLFAAHLSSLGNSETHIGIFFGLTLLGDLFIAMILTQIADAVGRKKVLIFGSVMMTFSGVVFASTKNDWALLGAAVVGVVSPSATEVGPFKAIEESALFTVVTENIVDVLSWYGTAEFASVAAGLAVSGGIMNHLTVVRGWDFASACRCVFVVYAAIGIVKIVLSACMSERIEAWHDGSPEERGPMDEGNGQATQEGLETAEPGEASQHAVTERAPLLPSSVPKLVEPEDKKSSTREKISKGLLNSVFSLNFAERALMYKLLPLMGTDSCAVGMSSTYFVRTKFNVSEGPLGLIFFFANILGACGTIYSNALARRMGNLMVCVPDPASSNVKLMTSFQTVATTYIPAGIFIALFGVPKNLRWMLVIVLIQSFLEPIYIAPRNAFVGHVINKKKRTAILGIINMVKVVTNATGSFLTGVWADRGFFWLAFIVAGCLKVVYCLAFLYMFLAVDQRMEKEVEQKKQEEERREDDNRTTT